jgi:hypothetical protein
VSDGWGLQACNYVRSLHLVNGMRQGNSFRCVSCFINGFSSFLLSCEATEQKDAACVRWLGTAGL